MNITIKSGKPTITLHEADKRKLSGSSALLRSIVLNTDNKALATAASTAREALSVVLGTLTETPEVDTPRDTIKADAA